ncbi:alpha/beta hydrolase [Corticibacter populi]|uniref:Alpha/beta hydrolase n=2 Tax=Corticibacter populi TaxID=1550736 RepID=A0A3M6QZU0_9BURK|nr:alpha/beta hydrolase [Corticibacter populi]
MRSVLERMARAGHPPLYTLSAQKARQAYSLGSQVLEETAPELARTLDTRIPARDGHAMPVRLYVPQAATGQALPAVLYLHGGGFTIGGIGTHDVLCRRLAHNTGAAVVSLEYRMAPEHRFPTAVDDTWDALAWLARHGRAWELDAGRLAVAGDSAGGTLAAVLALLARDAGLPLHAQVLIYPGTCAHQDTPSHRCYANGPVLSKPMIDWFFDQYIPQAQREDWRFAPLLAPELDGVAPALFVLAECDPLVDEGIAYADRLRMAGVPVQLELFRGVAHEFIKMGRALREAQQAHAAIGAFLHEAFAQE